MLQRRMAKHTIKIPLDKDRRVTTSAPAFYSVFNYDGLKLIHVPYL